MAMEASRYNGSGLSACLLAERVGSFFCFVELAFARQAHHEKRACLRRIGRRGNNAFKFIDRLALGRRH